MDMAPHRRSFRMMPCVLQPDTTQRTGLATLSVLAQTRKSFALGFETQTMKSSTGDFEAQITKHTPHGMTHSWFWGQTCQTLLHNTARRDWLPDFEAKLVKLSILTRVWPPAELWHLQVFPAPAAWAAFSSCHCLPAQFSWCRLHHHILLPRGPPMIPPDTSSPLAQAYSRSLFTVLVSRYEPFAWPS